MFDYKRVLMAAGLALALMAANQAPFDGEVGSWIAGDLTIASPQADDMAGLEPPVLAEDPEILRQALLEPPAITVRGDAGSLHSLVSEARWHATSAEMDSQMECLALSVYWEAKGEPVEGQLAVAQVILNRVARGRFGDSICAVVKAPRQFSFVRGGQIARPIDGKAWAEARAIAWIALADAWKPVVGEATHFHATRVNPGWRMQRVAQIGNHIFYR
jgi:hypothetical protein